MHNRLKEMREDKDIKQKVIAKYLSCDQSLYSKYERGKREVPTEVIVKMAKFYGTSTDYLLYMTDESKPYPASKKVPCE